MSRKSPGRIKRDGRAAFTPGEDPELVCPFGWQADLYVWNLWLDGWREAEAEYRYEQEREPTTEERVEKLEARIADLEDRVSSVMDLMGCGQ